MLKTSDLTLKDAVIVQMDDSEVRNFGIIRSINEATGEVICQGTRSVHIKTSVDSNGCHWGRVTKVNPEDKIEEGSIVLVDGLESLVIDRVCNTYEGFRPTSSKVTISPLSDVIYYHVNIKDLGDKWNLAFK
jgi:hypothetical protein